MSTISPLPFVRISRPEVRGQFGPVAVNTERDLAEQVSDALLYFASIVFYEEQSLNNEFAFREIPSNAIVQGICLVLAWTLWLPFTLLGMLIVLFSASHEEQYRRVHAQCWSEQTEWIAAGNEPEKLKPLFEEAINCDYLFTALLKNFGKLLSPEWYIPVLLDCFVFSEPRRRHMFDQLLKNAPLDHLRLYMMHCLSLERSPVQREIILNFCFNLSGGDNTEESRKRVVAGFMGIMHAAVAFDKHLLNIPKDTIIFSSQTVQALQGWVSKNPADVKFIKENRETILKKIDPAALQQQSLASLGNILPDHPSLVLLIDNLSALPALPVNKS